MHIGDYARGFKTGGNDRSTVESAKKLTRGTPKEQPPMANAPTYNPVSCSFPAYNGAVQTTTPAKVARDAHPGTKVSY